MEPNSNATQQAVLTLNKESLPALERTRGKIKFGFDMVTFKVYNSDLNPAENLLVNIESREIEGEEETEEEGEACH